MFHILRHSELIARPKLAETMFKDRAAQFVSRLNWDIGVTFAGLEIDQYDDAGAVYIVATDINGRHAASMRLRPSLGATMLQEVFSDRFDVPLPANDIWESTRFCVAPNSNQDGAVRVLLAGQSLGLAQGLEASLGVVYKHTLRIYRRLGWEPEVLQSASDPTGSIVLGAWHFDHLIQAGLARRAGLKPRVAKHWVKRALGYNPIFN
ncbi:MAG: acyl-homoserine-lactone synthase [Pseudomonadota bacterium]